MSRFRDILAAFAGRTPSQGDAWPSDDAAEEARRSIDEYDELLTRLQALLTGTANALKGEPPELTWHDWSDLPEVARATVADRDRLQEIVNGLTVPEHPVDESACTSDPSKSG